MNEDINRIPNQEAHKILSLVHAGQENTPPILVVGMHNSGTSMLTEILHDAGVFFGVSMKHHESHFFTNFINDRLIMGGGDQWAKLPLMPVEEVLSFEEVISPLIKSYWLVDYLQWGYDGTSPWGIKDPRLCVLLPLYLRIFPGAKVVHIQRRPEDVAASLSGKFKAGVGILDDFEHWKALTQAYTQRVLDYSGECAAYFELSYEEFCQDPGPLAQELFNYLGILFSDNTPNLLANVTPNRIGSYQRMMEYHQHPLRSRLKSLLSWPKR